MVETALLVCTVESTRCPVEAASSAAWPVCPSRISPTTITSGSCRSSERTLLAKVIPVLLHSRSEDLALIRDLVAEGLVAVIPFPPNAATTKRALRDYFRRVTSKEITRLVQTSEFFQDFSEEELKTLAKIAIPRLYQAGETIFHKGDPGDTFYIFSDGYADQFGGEKGKKFKAANFKSLLLSMQSESMEQQRELIDEAFENWRGSLEQLDDVCVIGVRIS